MAARVTPAFDFGEHDRPTKETLMSMVEGMTIDQVALANLATDVVIIVVNDTTAASNTPVDGSMWVDAKNNLWGRNKWGNVKIKRFQGGLETNRFLSTGDGGGSGNALPGQVCAVTTNVAAASAPTSTRLFGSSANGFDTTTVQIAVAQETTPSNGTTHARFCLLGPTRLHSPDFQPTFNAKRGRLYQKAVNSNFWTMEDHDPGNTPGHSAQAEAIERDPEVPGVDAGGSCVFGYYFGLPIRKA